MSPWHVRTKIKLVFRIKIFKMPPQNDLIRVNVDVTDEQKELCHNILDFRLSVDTSLEKTTAFIITSDKTPMNEGVGDISMRRSRQRIVIFFSAEIPIPDILRDSDFTGLLNYRACFEAWDNLYVLDNDQPPTRPASIFVPLQIKKDSLQLATRSISGIRFHSLYLIIPILRLPQSPSPLHMTISIHRYTNPA